MRIVIFSIWCWPSDTRNIRTKLPPWLFEVHQTFELRNWLRRYSNHEKYFQKHFKYFSLTPFNCLFFIIMQRGVKNFGLALILLKFNYVSLQTNINATKWRNLVGTRPKINVRKTSTYPDIKLSVMFNIRRVYTKTEQVFSIFLEIFNNALVVLDLF